MAKTKDVGDHILAPVGNWLSSSLWPWVDVQVAAVGSQSLALTLSAVAGGLISWAITRHSDQKSRQTETERDEEFRREQERRDKQRNLFEYRHWKATESASREKSWNVYFDTSPWYRYNWILHINPKFKDKVTSVRFYLESMNPEKSSVELTDKFSSHNRGNHSFGVRWVEDKQKTSHWVVEQGDSSLFVFDIGEIINDIDLLAIVYKTENGGLSLESHSISPFHSMEDYRPWEVVNLDEDEQF